VAAHLRAPAAGGGRCDSPSRLWQSCGNGNCARAWERSLPAHQQVRDRPWWGRLGESNPGPTHYETNRAGKLQPRFLFRLGPKPSLVLASPQRVCTCIADFLRTRPGSTPFPRPARMVADESPVLGRCKGREATQ
jgi:hypothetical protein